MDSTQSSSTNLAKDSMIMLFALVFSGLLSVVVSVVIARSVGVEEFGLYSILISLQSVVSLLAGFGIGLAMAKLISEYLVKDLAQSLEFAKFGFLINCIFLVIACTGYVLLRELIGDELYHEPRITSLIPFSAIVVASSTISTFAFGIVQGCQRFVFLSTMRIASSAISVGVVTVLVVPYGLEGALVGFSITQSIVALGGLFWLRRTDFDFFLTRKRHERLNIIRRLLGFAFPAMLSSSIVLPVLLVGSTKLTLVSGFQELGYFAIALVFYNAFILVPQAVSIPLVPRISELSVKSPNSAGNAAVKSTIMLSSILFPIVYGVGLFSGRIITLFFGSSYLPAIDAVYLIAITSYFSALATVAGSLIIGMGRMWIGLGANIIWASSFLILVFWAVPIFDSMGLALTYTTSYGIYLVSILIISKMILKIDFEGVYLPVLFSLLFFALGFLELIGKISLFGDLGKVMLLCLGTVTILIAEYRFVKSSSNGQSIMGTILNLTRIILWKMRHFRS